MSSAVFGKICPIRRINMQSYFNKLSMLVYGPVSVANPQISSPNCVCDVNTLITL